VRATTHRKYVDGAAEELSKMRLKRSVYMSEKLKTPKQLTSSSEFKSLSEGRQEKILNLIEKPKGSRILVPESDPRQEVGVDVDEIFSDVPTQTVSFL
jgi:hypothetical protein